MIVPDPLYIEIATDLQKKCSTAFPLVHADLILAAKEALASRQDERRRLAVRDALLHFVEVLVDWAAFEIGKGPSLKVLLRGKGFAKTRFRISSAGRPSAMQQSIGLFTNRPT